MPCPDCNADVVEAINASDGSRLLLDSEPTREGAWMVSSCCADHEPVARKTTSILPGFAEHDCTHASGHKQR